VLPHLEPVNSPGVLKPGGPRRGGAETKIVGLVWGCHVKEGNQQLELHLSRLDDDMWVRNGMDQFGCPGDK